MRPVRVVLTSAAVLALAAGCAPSVPSARSGAGQVTTQATTDAYSIRVGDCTTKLPTDTTEKLVLVPCSQAHHWEAFYSTDLPGDPFPGAGALKRTAEKICEQEFAAFVGKPSKKSKLKLTMLTPTSQTWTQAGDRALVCLAGNPAGGITGTVKDSRR